MTLSNLKKPVVTLSERAKALGFTTMSDVLMREYPRDLVRGLFPQIGTTCLYGAPGTKKSFVTLDIALSVAAGIDVWNRNALQGVSIYVTTEGRSGLRARAEAWANVRDLDIEMLPVALLEKPVNIRDDKTLTELIGCIKLLEKEWNLPCRFVAVDTLSRCLFGDENRQEDMTEFAAAMTRISEELQTQACAVWCSKRHKRKC